MDLTSMKDAGIETLPSLTCRDNFTTTLVLDKPFPTILPVLACYTDGNTCKYVQKKSKNRVSTPSTIGEKS